MIVAVLALGAALAGTAVAGPDASTSASVKKQVKQLKKRVAALESQGQVPGPPGDPGAEGPPGPSTGPAGGDLQGSYPDPSLKPPPDVTLAGLPDAGSGISCQPGDGWQDLDLERDVGYYRDPFGRVYLQGSATKCGSGTPGASDRIFTLPPGFRPVERGFYPAMAAAPGGTGFGDFGAAVVGADGSVFAVVGNFSASTFGFISLDAISFRCGPSGADGCP